MLSKGDLELYRKGLRTEREGQGIGAAAYFDALLRISGKRSSKSSAMQLKNSALRPEN